MLEDPSLLEHPPVVQVDDADGAPTYVVAAAPDALSPVTERDLARAWDAVGQHRAKPRPVRRFRFEHQDGCLTELAVVQGDARAWADAGEEVASLRTFYGVSLCLRLLSLSGLVASLCDPDRSLGTPCHTPLGATPGTPRRPGQASPSRALLRAAAHVPFTRDGAFDEPRLRTLLAGAAPLAKESRA